MSTTPETEQRLEKIEALLSRIDLAITGDGVRGVTGLVHTTQALHRRIDECEKNLTEVRTVQQHERWYGRVGAAFIGAMAGVAAGWFKTSLGR
jgi:hypothetical protein